jgi:hypothetical protein
MGRLRARVVRGWRGLMRRLVGSVGMGCTAEIRAIYKQKSMNISFRISYIDIIKGVNNAKKIDHI